MPVHPKEEETTGNLTDMVAKESKDSTASDHPIHDEDHSDKTSGGKAKAEDHKSKVSTKRFCSFLWSYINSSSERINRRTRTTRRSSASHTLLMLTTIHDQGPVINQDIGEPASKEELKKRSDELNK